MQTTFGASQDWGSGLVGFLLIENDGAAPLDTWTITFESTFEIDSFWGGDILSRIGNRYTIGAKSWNSRLEPGESTRFGFVGQNATAYPHQLLVIPDVPVADATTTVASASEQAEVAIESVDFAVTEQWGRAFNAHLSFTYSGTEPIDSWEIQFSASFPLLNVWHGELIEQNGNLYTIRNSKWNGILLPGDTITILVKAAGTFAEAPTDYFFNGVPIADDTGSPVIIEVPADPTVPEREIEEPPVEDPVSEIPAEDSIEELPTEEPVAENPIEESPVEEPVSEAPVEQPITELPAEENPIEESPVEEPVSEAPAAETPVAENPTEESPIEEPVAEPLPIKDPSAEELPLEQPVGEKVPDKPPVKEPIVSENASPNYGEALQKSFLFYEAQRSGDLPEDNRIAWRGDSALSDGADVNVDLTGGYYDAGDHVKFGFPMAGSATMLSWGIYEYYDAYVKSGQLDEALDAVRWATDYFLKAHISDGQATKAFYGQVGDPTIDHQYWGAPEQLNTQRPAYKIDAENPGSDLAAETAAALASASLVFRATDPAYADELLANAKQLYAFADTYRGRYSDSIPQARDYYNSWSGYTDELAWGAAWLYKATGEQQYLDKAQQNHQNLGLDWTHNWDDKSYGTGVLLAQITNGQPYRIEVESWLNNWVSGGIQTTAGGLAWLDEWGALRYSANTAFIAGVYSDTVNPAAGQYDRFSRSQIDYILGENPAEQSYVAGIGTQFPKNIHHRASSGTTDINNSAPNQHVLYGALVGGPRLPNDFSYVDERTDFLGNEVALDFNAGFTGAVARLYGQEGGELLSDAALIALSETGLPGAA